MKEHVQPMPINAGSKKVLLNGNPPKVDCRVIAEVEYKRLRKAFEILKAIHEMK